MKHVVRFLKLTFCLALLSEGLVFAQNHIY